jgi:hypothetical protein
VICREEGTRFAEEEGTRFAEEEGTRFCTGGGHTAGGNGLTSFSYLLTSFPLIVP